jgi:hypothetical protein
MNLLLQIHPQTPLLTVIKNIMSLIKNKSLTFRKTFLVLFLVLFFAFSPVTRPAEAWDAIPAAIYKQAMETIQKVIDGIKLGLAKQAAISALQAEVKFLVTGKSAKGSIVITNYDAFMYSDPKSKANVYINDYITQSTRGRGSLSGYISSGGEGVGGSYMNQLTQGAKATTSSQPAQLKPTFAGNPSQMFAGPQPFQQLNLYLSGVNNPWAFNLNVQQKYQEKLQQEQTIAQTQAIAGGGFKGVQKNGVTTMPGSLVKDQVSKVQNLGMDVIAAAQHLPEIITSAVSMTINQAMVSGIGMIQASVHQEVTNVRNNAKLQMNAAVKTSGPGALYNH